MKKDIFWMILIFIISLIIYLFRNNHNMLALAIICILCVVCFWLKIKILLLINKDQDKKEPFGKDKVEIVFIVLILFSVALSKLFPQYEDELLSTAILLTLAQLIRDWSIKTKKNS